MNDFKFADAILEKTNGGLDIIQDYYSNAVEKKKFKLRSDEKTASASLIKVNNTWLVRDWGDWEKAKNAIGVCMYEDNLNYIQACTKLAKLYNIEYKGNTYQARPKIERRPKKDNENPKSYSFEFNKELSVKELELIGKNVTQRIADKYKLKSCKSYSYVKDNEVITTIATNEYPILVFDFKTWQKIYQPLSSDKKYRFRYAGTKPTNYINGLDQVKKAYKKIVEAYEDDYNYDEDDDKKKKKKEPKLDNIIICSGDRDALNVASFGYNVVWLNSETATLDWNIYKTLQSMTTTLYNLPDIDKTGVQQGVQLAMKYLDIKTIWLPDYLKFKRDFRGNKCKDVRDFVTHFYNPKNNGVFSQLKKLVQNALPMKFWDEAYSERLKKMTYSFNIVVSHHFLKHSGFYRLETPFEKEDYCYIKINGNVVSRVTPNIIENFVSQFLVERQIPVSIRNMVLKTPYLKEATLSKLPLITLDFTDFTPNSQYWFFKDFSLEITKNGLKTHKSGELDKYVWEDNIIDHTATSRDFIEKPHFNIFTDKNGDLDIDVLKTDNKYFNYLINASRIHWQKDLEDSFDNRPEKEAIAYAKKHKFDIAAPNLNADEILEQKLHLINKIYALGYLLHKYKNASKAWFVFAIDNKLSDLGESHGGSGKSIALEYLKHLLKRVYVKGRDTKITSSDFFYERVTKETDIVLIDDMDRYFPFQFLFSDITSDMVVNPKNNKSFELPFSDSPKICGSSNFPPRNIDPSSARRILYMVFSDYYHYKQDESSEYKQTRQVSDDFNGKNLFTNFNTLDFNNVFNFFAQCIQFYLSHNEKIEPPMNNVTKRNLLAVMGASFIDWVYVYFSEETGRLDNFVSKKDAFLDFSKSSKSKITANRFKKSLVAFCKYNNYILNPIEMQNDAGRIIQTVRDDYNKRVTTEMIYIKTKELPKTETEEPKTENEKDNLDF